LYKSLLKYGYQSFTLEILEIVNVDNLNSTEARIMLLDREQYYIDLATTSLVGVPHRDWGEASLPIVSKGSPLATVGGY
jgi:hypothetical protein